MSSQPATTLREVSHPALHASPDESGFLDDVARALWSEFRDAREDADLTVRLLVGASLRRRCVGHETACRALMALRRAIIDSSELDAASEPVPLVVGDRRQGLINLVGYLEGLLARASQGGDNRLCRRQILEPALREITL
jgi:hypothetical protein